MAVYSILSGVRFSCTQLDEEEPAEDIEGEDEIAMYREWTLPSRDFHGLWESLMYESEVKRRLLRYSASALHFSDSGVNSQLISWNRVVLLHGPPGTGKTSLCKALAHKLAIKFGTRFVCRLTNTHSHRPNPSQPSDSLSLSFEKRSLSLAELLALQRPARLASSTLA